METSAPSRRRFAHPIAIAFAALLLLAGAVGLVVWLYSGPSAYASGHRWALYPSTGNTPEPDNSADQEQLAFDGNVKLLSLLSTEHLTDSQGEQFREALCHVLIDLPPKGVLRMTGGGGSGVDNFGSYRMAKAIIPQEGKAPLEVALKVEVRHSDQTFWVRVGEDSMMGFLTFEAGNIFIVRIGDDGKIDGFMQSDERIEGELKAADVERLLGKAKPD